MFILCVFLLIMGFFSQQYQKKLHCYLNCYPSSFLCLNESKTQWKTVILSRDEKIRLVLGRRVATWILGCPDLNFRQTTNNIFNVNTSMFHAKSGTYSYRNFHTKIGEANGSPLQYSCLENPMDRGAWRATVHGVAKSQIQQND